MTKTEILFDCYEYRLTATTTEFRIETSVQTKGELPQEAIFVMNIVVSDDPGADTFNRVGSPRDLRELKISRALALAAGATEYLSNTMTLSYPLLDVGVAAKATVTSRINECINAWITYRDAFEDTGTTAHPFPTVDASYEQSLKDSYTSAKDNRIAKQTASETAATAVTTAESAAANAAALLALYTVETDFCTKDRVNAWVPLKGYFTNFATIEETQVTALKGTFMNLLVLGHSWPPTSTEIAAFTADQFDFYSEINAASAGVDSYKNSGAPLSTTLDTDFQAFCSNAAISKTAATLDKASKDTAAANAATAKEEADAALASAILAEAAALAAVKAVCPDFDPNA
jgi:hypothetical protein